MAGEALVQVLRFKDPRGKVAPYGVEWRSESDM